MEEDYKHCELIRKRKNTCRRHQRNKAQCFSRVFVLRAGFLPRLGRSAGFASEGMYGKRKRRSPARHSAPMLPTACRSVGAEVLPLSNAAPTTWASTRKAPLCPRFFACRVTCLKPSKTPVASMAPECSTTFALIPNLILKELDLIGILNSVPIRGFSSSSPRHLAGLKNDPRFLQHKLCV